MGEYYFDFEDYFENMPREEAFDFFGIFIAIYLAIFVIAIAVSFAMYLFQAVGIYRMGRAVDVPTPWLAFIPFGDIYALGKVAQTPTFGKKPIKYSIIMLSLYIASLLSIILGYITAVSNALSGLIFADSMTPGELIGTFMGAFIGLGIGLLLSVICSVFYYIALYKVYKLFAPDNAVLYLVLSILFNIAIPIILFCLRNKAPIGYMGTEKANASYGSYYKTPYETVYPPYGNVQNASGAQQYTASSYYAPKDDSSNEPPKTE